MAARQGQIIDPKKRLVVQISAAQSRFRVAFLVMVREMVDAHTLQDLKELLAANQVTSALSRLDDPIETFGDSYGASFTISGQKTAQFLGDNALNATMIFDDSNTRVLREIRRNKLRLVREFTAEQKKVTRRAIARGVKAGYSPRKQAREFKASIGLTSNQERRAENFKRLLSAGPNGEPLHDALTRELRDKRYDSSIRKAIASREPLPQQTIDTMVQRHRRRFFLRGPERLPGRKV